MADATTKELAELRAMVEELKPTVDRIDQLQTENEVLKRQLQASGLERLPTTKENREKADALMRWHREKLNPPVGRYDWVVTPILPAKRDSRGRRLKFGKLVVTTDKPLLSEAHRKFRQTKGTSWPLDRLEWQAVGFEPEDAEPVDADAKQTGPLKLAGR